MIRLKEFLETFDIVVNTMNDQDVICSSVIGSALQDHKDFVSAYPNFKTFLKPKYHEGYPYVIGYIDNVSVLIEPQMVYNDMRLFKSNRELIYDFSKYTPTDII